MPRVCTSANDPLDFCRKCFPSEVEALEEYGNVGDGPDGRGDCFDYDAYHPYYKTSGYTCITCGEPLGVNDEHGPDLEKYLER